MPMRLGAKWANATWCALPALNIAWARAMRVATEGVMADALVACKTSMRCVVRTCPPVDAPHRATPTVTPGGSHPESTS